MLQIISIFYFKNFNVQVTGTYKSSLYMYTLSYSTATYKLLVRIGFEIHLEQNHKTTANTPDMT